MKKTLVKRFVKRLGGALMALVLTAPVSLASAQQTWPGTTYTLPINWGAIILMFLFPAFIYFIKGERARDVPNVVYLFAAGVGFIVGQFFFAGILPNIGFAAAPAPTPSPAPTPTPSPTPTPEEVTGTIKVFAKNWLDGSTITSNAVAFLVTPDIWAKYNDPIKIVADKKAGILNVPTSTVDSNGAFSFVGFPAKQPYSEYYLVVTDSAYSTGYADDKYDIEYVKLKVYAQKDLNGILAVSPGYVSLAKLGPGKVVDESLTARTAYTWVYNGTLTGKTFSFTVVPDVPSSATAGKMLQAWAIYYKTIPATSTSSITVNQILINGQVYVIKKITDLDPNDPLYVNKPDSTYQYVVLVNVPGYIRSANSYDQFTVTFTFDSSFPLDSASEQNKVVFTIVPLATGKYLGFTGSTFTFIHADGGTAGWS